MTVVSFLGGAHLRKGGFGLVGVPLIGRSTAEQGHHVIMVVCGRPSPGSEQFVVPDIQTALTRKEGTGTFGIILARAWGVWAFAPQILWQFNEAVRQADFVTLHSLYSFPVLAGYILARRHNKPYGFWPHGVLAPFQRKVSPIRKWVYDKLIGRRLLDEASVLFFSAPGERDETADMKLRAPSAVIPHGIDTQAFAKLPRRGNFRRQYLNDHRGPLVMFLARLNAKKGIQLLTQAMRHVLERIPDARLAIVGPPDPPSFERLVKQWVRDNGIEANTVLTGQVSNDGRLDALADADVFVLPSEAENFGFSVFEAMASRVPVVVRDSLNYAGEIASRHAGFATGRDPEELAAAIAQLLEDPGLCKEMGANGVEMARDYSWTSNGTHIEIAMECILNRRPLPVEVSGQSGEARRVNEVHR